MKGDKLGKVFLWFTIIAAVFTGISFLILESMLFSIVGLVFFIFGTIMTLCIDKKYKEIIIKLLDFF